MPVVAVVLEAPGAVVDSVVAVVASLVFGANREEAGGNEVVVSLVFGANREEAGGNEAAVSLIFGANRDGAGGNVVVPEADLFAVVVVVAPGFPKLLKSADV